MAWAKIVTEFIPPSLLKLPHTPRPLNLHPNLIMPTLKQLYIGWMRWSETRYRSRRDRCMCTWYFPPSKLQSRSILLQHGTVDVLSIRFFAKFGTNTNCSFVEVGPWVGGIVWYEDLIFHNVHKLVMLRVNMPRIIPVFCFNRQLFIQQQKFSPVFCNSQCWGFRHPMLHLIINILQSRMVSIVRIWNRPGLARQKPCQTRLCRLCPV